MRVTVVGAGALGCAYGGLLAGAGAQVTLIDVRRDHAARLNRQGLVLVAPSGAETAVAVRAGVDPAAAADADAALVLTKSYATVAAARSLAPHLPADAIAVTLQNGLGNDVALADALGGERVVLGSTTLAAEPSDSDGARLDGPWRVRVAPVASVTVLAEPRSAPARERIAALAGALRASGLPVEVRPDAGTVAWRKLALTASIGPLCALLRCTVAEALERPAAVVALRRLFDEAVAVARSEGIPLDGDELWEEAVETWRGIGAHRPSIAVDVLAGRPTEIDALSGALHRLGAASGVPTPATRLVAAAVAAASPSPD